MPIWNPIQRTFDAIRNRYDLTQRIGEMLTGILPVIVLDRHWPGEQMDFYGLNAATDAFNAFPAPPVHLYIELQAPPDREVLIWAIEATALSVGTPQENPLHLFTPLQDYATIGGATPWIPNGVLPPIYFPWLQPIAATDAGRLSASFARAGATSALQVVSVNGIPTTSIGPTKQTFNQNTGGFVASWGNEYTSFYSSPFFPPIRLKPDARIAVQTTTAGNTGVNMEANFWYSERLYAEGQ